MPTLLVHIANSEPVKVDCDEIPSPTDTVVVGRNPRGRDNKEVTWLEDGVTTVMFPWWRINFVQVLPDFDAQEEYPTLFRND